MEGVIDRDLDHLHLIRSLIPAALSSPIVFLNFGAGHGGISHLMHLLGHRIINVEPSGLRINYRENWETVLSLDEVSDKVDFVYGSHSLEHVSDVDKFLHKIMQILKPDGHIFLEVPNGVTETFSGKIRDIPVPHTYFFTKNFFNDCGFSIILNDTFKVGAFPNLPHPEGQSEVIRFLGKNVH